MLRILISGQSRYPTSIKALRRKIKDTLLDHSVTEAEVSVALVGERKMRELGEKYLGETKKSPVHEVLSFPSQFTPRAEGFGASPSEAQDDESANFGDRTPLGDIVICYPEARKIAIKKNRMMDDVVQELAEHATLHLLGIHHE